MPATSGQGQQGQQSQQGGQSGFNPFVMDPIGGMPPINFDQYVQDIPQPPTPSPSPSPSPSSLVSSNQPVKSPFSLDVNFDDELVVSTDGDSNIIGGAPVLEPISQPVVAPVDPVQLPVAVDFSLDLTPPVDDPLSMSVVDTPVFTTQLEVAEDTVLSTDESIVTPLVDFSFDVSESTKVTEKIQEQTDPIEISSSVEGVLPVLDESNLVTELGGESQPTPLQYQTDDVITTQELGIDVSEEAESNLILPVTIEESSSDQTVSLGVIETSISSYGTLPETYRVLRDLVHELMELTDEVSNYEAIGQHAPTELHYIFTPTSTPYGLIITRDETIVSTGENTIHTLQCFEENDYLTVSFQDVHVLDVQFNDDDTTAAGRLVTSKLSLLIKLLTCDREVLEKKRSEETKKHEIMIELAKF